MHLHVKIQTRVANCFSEREVHYANLRNEYSVQTFKNRKKIKYAIMVVDMLRNIKAKSFELQVSQLQTPVSSNHYDGTNSAKFVYLDNHDNQFA